MFENSFHFFLLALASFRLTRLVVYDKITEFIRNPFFDEIEEVNEKGEKEYFITPKTKGIRGWIGALLSCHWCTGVWSAIFLVLAYRFGPNWFGVVIVILAVAGLAALIETLVQKWMD
ncbi:DUF1360 domain-containing protein [Peribacillus acanthi]|uniref:DUF1360 domain-containing protein n=1 Tax=Peribacillus acanthi TaxID=2171554 RepID=UPI000D3E3545|nr:DUF1360 domain-containing protein [Peribacillus acanthi]